MRTVVIVVVIVALALVGYSIIVPYGKSDLQASRWSWRQGIDKGSSIDRLLIKINLTREEAIGKLAEGAADISGLQRGLAAAKEENEELKQEREKHLRYLDLGKAMLAKADGAFVATSKGKRVSAEDLVADLRYRMKRVNELDKLIPENEERITVMTRQTEAGRKAIMKQKKQIIKDAQDDEMLAAKARAAEIQWKLGQTIRGLSNYTLGSEYGSARNALQRKADYLDGMSWTVGIGTDESNDTLYEEDNNILEEIDSFRQARSNPAPVHEVQTVLDEIAPRTATNVAPTDIGAVLEEESFQANFEPVTVK